MSAATFKVAMTPTTQGLSLWTCRAAAKNGDSTSSCLTLHPPAVKSGPAPQFFASVSFYVSKDGNAEAGHK